MRLHLNKINKLGNIPTKVVKEEHYYTIGIFRNESIYLTKMDRLFHIVHIKDIESFCKLFTDKFILSNDTTFPKFMLLRDLERVCSCLNSMYINIRNSKKPYKKVITSKQALSLLNISNSEFKKYLTSIWKDLIFNKEFIDIDTKLYTRISRNFDSGERYKVFNEIFDLEINWEEELPVTIKKKAIKPIMKKKPKKEPTAFKIK